MDRMRAGTDADGVRLRPPQHGGGRRVSPFLLFNRGRRLNVS